MWIPRRRLKTETKFRSYYFITRFNRHRITLPACSKSFWRQTGTCFSPHDGLRRNSSNRVQLLASFASSTASPTSPSSLIILQQIHVITPSKTTGVSLGSRAPASHSREEGAPGKSVGLWGRPPGGLLVCGDPGIGFFWNESQESVSGSGRVASSISVTETQLMWHPPDPRRRGHRYKVQRCSFCVRGAALLQPLLRCLWVGIDHVARPRGALTRRRQPAAPAPSAPAPSAQGAWVVWLGGWGAARGCHLVSRAVFLNLWSFPILTPPPTLGIYRPGWLWVELELLVGKKPEKTFYFT